MGFKPCKYLEEALLPTPPLPQLPSVFKMRLRYWKWVLNFVFKNLNAFNISSHLIIIILTNNGFDVPQSYSLSLSLSFYTNTTILFLLLHSASLLHILSLSLSCLSLFLSLFLHKHNYTLSPLTHSAHSKLLPTHTHVILLWAPTKTLADTQKLSIALFSTLIHPSISSNTHPLPLDHTSNHSQSLSLSLSPSLLKPKIELVEYYESTDFGFIE